MRKDILPYYRALGLSPGAEAIEIRRAYRQMVQQWHPDLYKPGSPMQTTAEDITKEINEAYEQLYRKKLYKNFLPKSERKEGGHSPAEREKPAEPTEAAPAKKRAPPRPRTTRPGKARRGIDWPKWNALWLKVRRSRWTRLAALTGAAAGVLFIGRAWVEAADFGVGEAPPVAAKQGQETHDPRTGTSKEPAPGPMPSASPTTSVVAPEAEFVPSRFAKLALLGFKAEDEYDHTLVMDRAGTLLDAIELGDSRARVMAIQGVPDEISDSIYRYGSSVIYFREGRVSAWRNRLPRLRIRDWSVNMLPTLDRFTMGSSRADVVRAQGLPGAFDATSYTYGSSIVSFDRGQVAGWSEGDVRLQHFEMPSLAFVDLDQINLWNSRDPLAF